MACCGRKLSPEALAARDRVTALQTEINNIKKDYNKRASGIGGADRRTIFDEMRAAVTPKREELRIAQHRLRDLRISSKKSAAPVPGGVAQQPEPKPEVKK